MSQVHETSDKNNVNRNDSRPGALQLLSIAFLVVLLSLGPAALLRQAYPLSSWLLIPVLVLIVALEGAWTTRWLSGASRRVNRPVYRLAELMTIMALVSIVYWLSLDKPSRMSLFDNFYQAPLSIINLPLLTLIILSILAWVWSNHLAGIFSKLALSEDEYVFFTTPAAERQKQGIPQAVPVFRNQLFNDYIRNWAIGGILLALFVMLVTFDLTQPNLDALQSFDFRNITRLGVPSELLLALIIYFVIGFWLASHARMAMMQARWTAGGHEIDPAIMSRWRRQVLVVILLVTGLAAFLPIGSTLAISNIIQVLLGYTFTVVAVLLSLIPMLLAWFLSLISGEPPEQQEVPLEIPPALPVPESPREIVGLPPNVLEWVSIATAALLAILALAYVLKYRNINFGWSWLTATLSQAGARLVEFWSRLTRESSKVVEAMRLRLSRPASSGRETRSPWRLLPGRAQTPRQKIRYYYLSILHRAEKQGVDRMPGQTPLEYEERLADNWPTESDDIAEMTRMFLMARYSSRPVTEQASSQANKVFRRLRSTLRQRLKSVSDTGD